jgi:hypothetical protein
MRHSWVLALFALVACSVSPNGTPRDATAIFRPADMQIDVAAAALDDTVEITFPEGMHRGLMYVLEERTGSSWTYRYQLISDASGGESSWHPAAQEVDVDAIGIGGPGPDRLVIPDVAPLGEYRICTANAPENVCVPLTVADE